MAVLPPSGQDNPCGLADDNEVVRDQVFASFGWVTILSCGHDN